MAKQKKPLYDSSFLLFRKKCRSLGELMKSLEDRMLKALVEQKNNIAYLDMRYSTAIALYAIEMDMHVDQILALPQDFHDAALSAITDCIMLEHNYRQGETTMNCHECRMIEELPIQIELNKLRNGTKEEAL